MNILYALRRVRHVAGSRPAILKPAGELTYMEFTDRVARAGHLLRRLGLGKGDRIATLMLNSPAYLELYLATAAAGVAIVPINTRWSPQEMRFVLTDSGAAALVVDSAHAAAGWELCKFCPALRTVVFAGDGPTPESAVGYEAALARETAAFDFPEPDENDIAGLFYTSGTTGGPKGVVLTHRNLMANATHVLVETGLDGACRYLHSAPMFHLANGAFMYAVLLRGGAHAFIPAFEPRAFLKATADHRINTVVLLPIMLGMVLNEPSFEQSDVSSLKCVFYGASPMPLELLRRANARLRCDFWQAYGMTETGPVLTMLRPEDHSFEIPDGSLTPARSAGRAIFGVDVRVVDEKDNPVPAGAAGEIVARGPNVMKGYWNRPEITAEVLAGGWMHTGDIGALDERGYLYVLDRKKEMIKTGGENVYSPEVENVLYRHPGVLEAAVVGVPHAKWGEAVKAVVVPRSGTKTSERELIEFCRERLTHYKCPLSVDFVESLPKPGPGKLRKAEWRERYRGAASGGSD